MPQASGESSKVKVKVRVNIHGIFSVSSASLVEVMKCEEGEEPMDTEQATEKDGEVKKKKTLLLHPASDKFVYFYLYLSFETKPTCLLF